MVTGLKAVSQKAGVSVSTASHILSGRPMKYAPETRETVLAAAKDLDYQPNLISRSLRTNKTATIGVVIHEMAQGLKEVERLATQRGYQLLLSYSRWDTQREENEIRSLLRRQVDGFLLMAPAIDSDQHKVIEELVRKGFPLVCMGVTLAKGADSVDWDRRGAYNKMTEHLLAQGCRRFLFLYKYQSPAVQARLEGVRDALKNVQGTELSEMNFALGEDAPAPVAQALASGWAEAVVCHTDDLALSAIKAARDVGRKVPEDLAVTGCSDQVFSALLDVPLTTIRMSDKRMVQLATERLFERINDRHSPPDHLSAVVPAELVIRQSSLFQNRKAGEFGCVNVSED